MNHLNNILLAEMIENLDIEKHAIRGKLNEYSSAVSEANKNYEAWADADKRVTAAREHLVALWHRVNGVEYRKSETSPAAVLDTISAVVINPEFDGTY